MTVPDRPALSSLIYDRLTSPGAVLSGLDVRQSSTIQHTIQQAVQEWQAGQNQATGRSGADLVDAVLILADAVQNLTSVVQAVVEQET